MKFRVSGALTFSMARIGGRPPDSPVAVLVEERREGGDSRARAAVGLGFFAGFRRAIGIRYVVEWRRVPCDRWPGFI